jgi:signal transduction histidine kinase
MGRRSADKSGFSNNRAAQGAHDVMARAAAESASAHQDRMIAIFAHDLRGLLNALSVNAEVFLGREGETAAASARSIRLAVRGMDQLISSLLDYSRLKANKLEVAPRPFDAADVVREAVELFRPLARVKSLSLTLAVPDAPLRAKADRDRMFQVLSNLLSNAIKFTSKRGKIVVEARSIGSDVHVAVGDDGRGIPERDLDRVFEGFCQLRKSDRGLGLGLYISRAIVQAHGGRIWATSRPGAGSTFSFTIPGSDSDSDPWRKRFEVPVGSPA